MISCPIESRQPVNVDGNCSRVTCFSMHKDRFFKLMKDGCYPDFCENCELDRETAKKILFEQPTVVSTPRSKEVSYIASSFCCDYPLNTSKCSSNITRSTKRRLTLNSECPPDCPYYQVGLPCHDHQEQTRVEPKKQKPLSNPDIIDQIDLRKIHHVPVMKRSPSPQPLPQKPYHVGNRISDKKYPYVGKVFHV